MTDSKKNHKKIADLILITSIIFISVIMICLHNGQRGDTVIVMIDGQETQRFDLDVDRTEVLKTASGGTNTLTIKNGTCSITDSNCDNRICIRQGAISKNGQSIICLPHHLVITIESNSENEVDSVAG